MQLYRVTDFYGGLLEQEKVLEVDAVEPDILKIDNQECIMLWSMGRCFSLGKRLGKRSKLGRIFKQSSCMDISNKRGWIRHSL